MPSGLETYISDWSQCGQLCDPILNTFFLHRDFKQASDSSRCGRKPICLYP
jgi:hypothetical protein